VLLILSPNGNGIQLAKLTDFGVCRVLEDADGSLSNIAGTFSYVNFFKLENIQLKPYGNLLS
jgi:hypothetical protein